MGNTIISLKLNDKDINRAIREVKKYKRDFIKKSNLFRKRVADEIAKLAQRRFDSSGVDDTLTGGLRQADVKVDVSDNGNISVVIAQGEDAVWCEFGAGVYYNGAVGSSPNPYGAKNGLTIGSYGKGHGKQSVWGYYADPGDKSTLVLTHGTQATMPMYRAVQDVIPIVVRLAGEVFG